MPEQNSGTSPEDQGQSFKSRITRIVNTGKETLFRRGFGQTSNIGVPQDEAIEHARPDTIEGVLEIIDPRIPNLFRTQAWEAASYIQLLDQGLGYDDPKIQRFLQQLKFTEFIYSVNTHHRLSWTNSPDPRESLPAWLQSETPKSSADQKIPVKKIASVIEDVFNTWVKQADFRSYVGTHGKYFVLDESPATAPEPRWFKCYVERDITQAIQDGRLSAVFRDLKEKAVNPNRMKLFEEDRLVLYYQKDINISDGIRDAFEIHRVPFRGPAQDVYDVVPTAEEQLEVEVHASNDGALGEGRHTPIRYKLRTYNPAEFLDNYLQLCLWAGKDPSEPYKTSFVYFLDTDGVIKDKRKVDSLLPEAERLAGYPVVYIKNRLDIAFD